MVIHKTLHSILYNLCQIRILFLEEDVHVNYQALASKRAVNRAGN